MATEIVRTAFVIAVTDLQRSAAFYRERLGFEIHEIGDPGWRFFERDGCRIMAGHCPDALPAGETGDHSYFAYFTVHDIDPYYHELCANQVEIIKPIADEPWGMREFGLRTIDGHRIMIGEPMDQE